MNTLRTCAQSNARTDANAHNHTHKMNARAAIINGHHRTLYISNLLH